MGVWRPRRHILIRSATPAKSILARAAHLFYSRRRGRCTNMILYSLFIIIYKKSTKQKSPAAGLAA